MIIAGPGPKTHLFPLSSFKEVVSQRPASPSTCSMTSLKRRRESPSPSTEPSPLLPFATNSNRSASISAPVPRRASEPVTSQISTDPIFASPYIYSPVYPPPNQSFKRQRVMLPSSPYPSTSAQEYAFSTASYDPSGISSLPTPTPTIPGATGTYGHTYSTSVSGIRSPLMSIDSNIGQPMPPSSALGGYPTPSTTFAQTPNNYPTQMSPVSPYGQTAYYPSTGPMGISFENTPSEQQIAKAKRQQQNRDAQKRFREKKKATQADMEQRLDELEKQLEESAQEIVQLQHENDQLKTLLHRQGIAAQQAMAGSGRSAGKMSRGGPSGRRLTQSP